MLTKEIALQFAGQWEKSWNSHDIERIISHYADDICLVSPIAGRIFGDPEVKGIEVVREYFKGSSTFHVDSRIFPAGLAIR